MTQRQIFLWIKENLGPLIRKALEQNPDVIYTEDWLGAMAYRETGFLIGRYADKKMKAEDIHALMKGDYSKRPGELEKQYHGFGYWQIDTGSYLPFIKAGNWKDPYKTCLKAIEVLEEKRIYLSKNIDFGAYDLQTIHRAITAAYNCGQGNVVKALTSGKDVDVYTHQGNYSKMVWEYRDFYRKL
jgi:hypothetical protein